MSVPPRTTGPSRRNRPRSSTRRWKPPASRTPSRGITLPTDSRCPTIRRTTSRRLSGTGSRCNFSSKSRCPADSPATCTSFASALANYLQDGPPRSSVPEGVSAAERTHIVATATRDRPVSRWARLRSTLTAREWLRLGAMFAVITALHLVGWITLVGFVAPHHFSLGDKVLGIGVGLTAYTLGLRHAFDADHIAAIDNTTRKLMNDGQRPLGVGFFFSLGHSSVVFGLALLIAFGLKAIIGPVEQDSSALHHYSSLIGTSVSGVFLYVIAIINVVILVGILRVFVQMRRGHYDEDELEAQLNNRGLLNRLLGRFTKSVSASWHMYPIGVLFGLGFDTATEVALLVLAGTSVVGGLPFYAILSLPILFAAGMSLFDTIDGCFMNLAYDLAFARPIRKVYYNLTIIGLSIFVALFVGTVELVGLLAQESHLGGPVWSFIEDFNINTAGFV